MKILLVGNYPLLKSQSMDRFAKFLSAGLKDAGHSVRLIKPPPVFGRIFPAATEVGKWLGYFDRFVLFRSLLLRAVCWSDVVHICDQANAIYVPWLKHKPHLVTCHDLLAIRCALGEFKGQETRLTGRYYQRLILNGLKMANHVVCVSRTTRNDLLRLAGISPVRTTMISNGLNYPYRPMERNLYLKHLEQMGLNKRIPFFLHVGNNNWYKNKPGLSRIFERMVHLSDESTFNLVLAGSAMTRNLTELAQDLGIYDRIGIAIDVTNEQLCALYSSALELIFPSLSEGFGWPVIEAQACGCPVFTSNRPPLTEVTDSGGEYFDPLNEMRAARIILEAVQYKDRFKKNGYKNVKKYSSLKMIDRYVQAYKSCISTEHPYEPAAKPFIFGRTEAV